MYVDGWTPSSFLGFILTSVLLRGLPANIQLDVDGDRETERIYSLFSTYMTKLSKMQGWCILNIQIPLLSSFQIPTHESNEGQL